MAVVGNSINRHVNAAARQSIAVLLTFPFFLSACGPDRSSDIQAQEPVRFRAESGPVTQAANFPPMIPDTATAARMSNAFRSAAGSALPAVVFIEVEATRQNNSSRFQRFFGGEPQTVEGSGSGFIVDREGHIITNYHVIRNASHVNVRLEDGRKFLAEVVGGDPNTDVAVIRIDSDRPLPVATFADSDELQVGDWVMALGSPLGLQFTVTAGIVSAKGRNLDIDPNNATALEAFVQTDAAINPGNSGGPLVDLYGRVVGVNTAISGPRFVGYGFAIPSNLAMRVAEDLIEFGVVRRPQLGVSIQGVSPADAEVYGLSEIAGAEIVSVSDGGPADRAGVRLGDVVLSVDGNPIEDETDLLSTIAAYHPGDDVSLTVFRDGAEQDVNIRLGEFDVEKPRALAVANRAEEGAPIGFSYSELSSREARDLGYRNANGVFLVGIQNHELRSLLGRPVKLLKINGADIDSAEDVDRIASEVRPGQAVSLLVEGVTEDGPQELIVNYRTRN